MSDFFRYITNFFHNRIVIMFTIICILFFILVLKLFNLQILSGDYFNSKVKATTVQDIVVPAPRGTIYDRFGRPLATNKSSFTANIDASISVENQNEVLLRLVNMLEKNKEDIVDDFPISKEKPFTFLYNGNESQENRWKEDMGLDKNLNATEAFYALREKFSVDEGLSDKDARKILSLRCALYQKRYSKYIPVTIAYDIKKETIAVIEEEKSNYPGIYVDVNALRYYPGGKYFSHILGYIRNITESELSYYKQYNSSYTQNDIVGKDGVEKAFELDLTGVKGKKRVEVDSVGRRINTISSETVEPIPGNKVFLTIDERLQKSTYNILEDSLKKTIINKLLGKSKYFNYSLKQLFMSMINSNNISAEKIMADSTDAYTASSQYKLKQYVLSVDSTAKEDLDYAKQILIDGIDKGNIASTQLILVLYEQGIISLDEKALARVKSGSSSALQIMLEKLNSNEITPQMTALDPSSGSVVVTDIYTGDILASVTYPSYDNNELVNNFNNKYYLQLQSDPTTPLVNRPFTEARAPGSTFKMITAIAGLEEGYITPYSTIYDKGTFKEAGLPYARCWIGSGKSSHGSINVSHALEVSCNYFFYDLVYRMGNSKNGTTEKSIGILNKYMRLFGLDDFTGVEIYELYNSTTNYPSKISSPEYKKYIFSLRNPDTPESDLKWYDGETIRTAIGQSFNNYTAATMTKYISTLANGGSRYPLHFLNKISSYEGDTLKTYTPAEELKIDIKPENLKAVHDGMHLVTSGSKGTLRNVFKNFPVQVAAKSGTAQQSVYRSDHTIFVGFAPYDNPQIAITVLIPFGDESVTVPAPTVAKNVIAEYVNLYKEPETKIYNTLTK